MQMDIGHSEKQIIMKYQPLLENVPSLENIIEYNDLSMRDLADMMKDDGFQINSKNNRTNQNKAHAMRNEHMRRNQEHENIPASVLQSHSLACPQQSIPGSQTTVGVNTGTTCQNTETMGSAIGLSCQLGDVQLEPAPGERTRHDPRWQAMAGVQPARATVQMVCEHIRDDSTFTVSHERMAPRNQIRMNANVLPSKTYREGKSPTDSTFLLPQYPGMTQINQISGEDIPGPGVQSTTAPANPQEMHLPRHEIPEATSTPPDTPHTEAGPSSHDTEPVGHTQQLSDHLMEPEPAHDGAVPILNMHIRSTTRICTIPESSTSITRLSTEQEINMLGSGLCGPVSQAKQRLEKTDARGLHMAHDEVETLVRNMLVPGGRVGASPLPGRDGEFGLLRDIEKFGGHGLLDRAQVGSVNDELEAAYTQLKRVPERQPDIRLPAPHSAIPPLQPAARELRTGLQGPQFWCCDSCVCPEDDPAVQRAILGKPQRPLPQHTVDEDRSRMPPLPRHEDLPPMFGYGGIRAVDQVEQDCAEHEVQWQPTSGTTLIELNVIMRIGEDCLLLGWNKLPENDESCITGFEIHVNNKPTQKIRAATRDRALLMNLDLSQSVKISLHAIAKDGRPLGALACICYKS